MAPDIPPLTKNPVFFYPNNMEPDIAIGIDKEITQKVYAVSAHESQFFEWLPYINGTLDNVPEGDEERRLFLGRRFTQANEAVKKCLVEWYGAAEASKIKNAEAFQVSSFGRQPGREELLKLFPMLTKQ